jgi:hypothetical protein
VSADSHAANALDERATADRSDLLESLDETQNRLTGHEYATVAAIAAIIVPTDQDPGATEANVAGYINRKVSRDALALQTYQEGVAWIDEASGKLFKRGQRFVDLSADEQHQVLSKAEETLNKRLRSAPSLPSRALRKAYKIWDDAFGLGGETRFFRIVREDTFAGFYTSPVSWAMLDYIGPPQPRGYPHYQDCPPQPRR